MLQHAWLAVALFPWLLWSGVQLCVVWGWGSVSVDMCRMGSWERCVQWCLHCEGSQVEVTVWPSSAV